MKNAIIKIEGSEVKLYPDTVITQSLKSFSIGELGTRSVNFTNRITAPREPNEAIFENAGNASSETLIPYRKKKATITQAGIDVVAEGVFSLNEVTEKSYEFSIFSGAKSFFETIDGLMLSNLTGFVFRGDVEYMADRRNSTDDVIYPVGYYGTEIGDVPVYQDLSFLFLHSVFERIFDDAGYEFDWTPPDSKFEKMVLSAYGANAKYAKSFIERLRAEVYVETPQSFNPGTGTPVNFTGIRSIGDVNLAYWDGLNSYVGNDASLTVMARLFLAYYKYSIDITVTGGTVDIQFGSSGPLDFTNVGSGSYSFESTSLSDYPIVVNGSGIHLSIKANGSPLFSDTDFSNWTNEGADAVLSPWDIDTETFWAYPNAIPGQPANSCFFRSGSFTVVPSGTSIAGNITAQAVNGTTGDMNIYMWDGSNRELIDTISVVGNGFYQVLSWSGTTTQNNTHIEIQYVITSGDTTVFVNSISFTGSSVSVTVNAGSLVVEPTGDYFNRVTASSALDFNYYAALLPDIKQSDLLKEIAIHYGLLFEESNGTVFMKRIDDIIADRANAKDWTRKRIKSKDRIKFIYQDYAKKNYFRYNAAENASELFGQGMFDIDNENLSAEKVINTSAFENTIMRYQGGFVFASIPVYDEADPAAYVRIFDNDGGSKILLVRDKYSYEPSVTYLDGNSYSDYKIVYFDDPNQDDTMDFQQDIDENYPLLTESLQRAKIVTRDYMLTELDIANFSFFFPIFDSGEYFLVNEVKNFIQSGIPTTVEMFKV